MLSQASQNVADDAKQLYLEKFRESLEAMHFGEFVCIEPVSGQCFLGITLDEAINKAIDTFPDRLTHTLRVGHSAALHVGAMLNARHC